MFKGFEENLTSLDSSAIPKFEVNSETIEGEKWDHFFAPIPISKEDVEVVLTESEDQLLLSMSESEIRALTFSDLYDATKEFIYEELYYKLTDFRDYFDKDEFDKLFNDEDFERTFTVTMPYRVKSNMGTTKGNTVTINLSEINGDLEVLSKETSRNPIYIGAAVGAVIGIGIAVFVIKKKKK